MAFTINQTGIERGATKLVFPDPPIMVQRHEEDAPDAAYDVSIAGNPVVVEYARDQQKTFMRLKVRYLGASEISTLQTLWSGSGPVTVKLTAGSATTSQAMFGPRKDQKLNLFSGDYATSKPDGTAVDSIFEQYWAELLLLRLE